MGRVKDFFHEEICAAGSDDGPDMPPPDWFAREVFNRYRAAYGDEIQGCCPLIADEIQREVGGEIVAGELTWYGGSCRRTHWWVEKDGLTLDPVGDWLLSHEEYPGREEAHRDRATFEAILPRYEQWRLLSARGEA